ADPRGDLRPGRLDPPRHRHPGPPELAARRPSEQGAVVRPGSLPSRTVRGRASEGDLRAGRSWATGSADRGKGFGRENGGVGPHPAVADVRRAVRESLADLERGRLVLAACSGGADSLALAAALGFVAPRAGLRAALVTVDHQLQEGSDVRARRGAERST